VGREIATRGEDRVNAEKLGIRSPRGESTRPAEGGRGKGWAWQGTGKVRQRRRQGGAKELGRGDSAAWLANFGRKDGFGGSSPGADGLRGWLKCTKVYRTCK